MPSSLISIAERRQSVTLGKQNIYENEFIDIQMCSILLALNGTIATLIRRLKKIQKARSERVYMMQLKIMHILVMFLSC